MSEQNRTVKEIVELYLKAHGYDGLYQDDGMVGCGCGVDFLFPCDVDHGGRQAGHLQDCAPGCECGGKYCMGPEKATSNE